MISRACGSCRNNKIRNIHCIVLIMKLYLHLNETKQQSGQYPEHTFIWRSDSSASPDSMSWNDVLQKFATAYQSKHGKALLPSQLQMRTDRGQALDKSTSPSSLPSGSDVFVVLAQVQVCKWAIVTRRCVLPPHASSVLVVVGARHSRSRASSSPDGAKQHRLMWLNIWRLRRLFSRSAE